MSKNVVTLKSVSMVTQGIVFDLEPFWPLASIPNSKWNPFSWGVKYTGWEKLSFVVSRWYHSTDCIWFPISVL